MYTSDENFLDFYCSPGVLARLAWLWSKVVSVQEEDGNDNIDDEKKKKKKKKTDNIYYQPSLFNAHTMILIVHIFMNVNKLCLNHNTDDGD